ncbi:adenylosuccinate lyase [Kitasatospora sp. MAA4]|uniref:adenylosuccinate lyase n=1 Tax=Kitasatospora sp. MAA4 TaxID=3035093 RepID=UPI002476EB94|nr:adenylosuccinate lyase [Kitasatospora sp. MAA4]MDH6137543.1 adenylosuccinate lyase [Kitasatospora sp. MAA4]
MLSPLDGRYRSIVTELDELLSEEALNRARLSVEVEWLVLIAAEQTVRPLRPLTADECAVLRSFVTDFGADQAAELGAIERAVHHDIKAVEYYLKRRMKQTSMSDVAEFVHFCCTSEDINNLAYGIQLRRAIGDVWLPAAAALVGRITELADRYRDQPMLGRTHGQPATPTTVGKELAVFGHRLRRQLERVRRQEFLGKFNGATGTYGAHVVACPDVDWAAVCADFVESLGLTFNPLTTQIEPHDYMAELFCDIARFNGIVHNFDTDMWQYIALGYFRQPVDAGSVGSSTMPHKVNPIRFENAEANTELSNALLRCLAENLTTSRMQRDLSDSSLLRNIGAALGHSLVAIVQSDIGLSGLALVPEALDRDLSEAWEVLGEACQSVMRRAGVSEPYERLKSLTRGAAITKRELHEFISALELPEQDKSLLMALRPADYVGLAARLVDVVHRG